MKIIIYALGRLFGRYRDKIDWSQVAALADKAPSPEAESCGVPVITPDLIGTLEYDYVAVFSSLLYEEIRMDLVGAYYVPQDRIIPWNEIVDAGEKNLAWMLEMYQVFLAEKECRKILDVGMSVLPKCCLTKRHFLSGADIGLDGVWGGRAIANDCLYDAVFQSPGDCEGIYDAVLLWDDPDVAEAVLSGLSAKTRYILLYTGYLWNGMLTGKSLEGILRKYGKVSRVSGLRGILWTVDTGYVACEEDVAIYVVTHKKYNVLSEKPYVPLCVGGFQSQGCLTEQSGRNIAHLNAKINECTALYWIWKNTDTKYVGMNHYRRYFYNNELKSVDNFLDLPHIAGILREYDIILTKVQAMAGTTAYGQLYRSMDHALCEAGYAAVRQGIANRQPQYLQAFDDVMNGHNIFLCNLFVTRREVLDRYCEWLFSFLIEAAEAVDVEGYDSYSRRVVGFFAERMWTVWLRRNRLKIKEQPYVLVSGGAEEIPKVLRAQ